MELVTRPAAAAEDLNRTVDYHAVSEQVKQLGVGREWKLIETLAEDVAALVLKNELVSCTRVEISKFILPDTRRVAVRVEHPRVLQGARV